MKKILFGLIIVMILIFYRRQGIPENFVGIYKDNVGSSSGSTLIIKKIGKNKYNLKCVVIWKKKISGKFDQDIKILKVITIGEKNSYKLSFKIKELRIGNGVEDLDYPDYTRYFNQVQVESFTLEKKYSSKEYELGIVVKDPTKEGLSLVFLGFKSYEY